MNKNLVHISDLIFYKKNTKEILEFLEKNKIENLEFFIEPLDEEYTKKMLEILENHKFKSISFHGPFRKCNLADMSNISWEKTLYSYEESFKISNKYNPSFMVLHSNEGIFFFFLDEDLKNKILEKIDLLVKLGKKYDIDVVIENVGIGKNMVFSQEEYEKIILKNDYKCLIDIGHAHLNKWNIEELIRKLENNILGYHFHNNNGFHDEHKPIFKGEIDYLNILELVKKYTSSANIVLEYDFNEDIKILLEDYNKLKEII